MFFPNAEPRLTVPFNKMRALKLRCFLRKKKGKKEKKKRKRKRKKLPMNVPYHALFKKKKDKKDRSFCPQKRCDGPIAPHLCLCSYLSSALFVGYILR